MPSVCLKNASLSLILASSFTWSAAAAPARADLKIVTEVTTTRSSPDASTEGKPGATAPSSPTDKASSLIPPRPTARRRRRARDHLLPGTSGAKSKLPTAR